MQNEIIVLGSCNIDFFSYVHKLPKPGETVQGKSFVTGFGGKGANQCVATAKLGGKTYFIARVGDDHWGKEYIEKLKAENVDTSYVQITKNVNTGIAQIAVEDSGENNIIIIGGANAKLSENDVLLTSDILKRGKVLLMQLESPIETALKALELFNGISILNAAPAYENMDKLLLIKPTILCVNESEASLILDVPVNDLREAEIAVSGLLKMGCQSVILTLGAKGALYASQESQLPIHIQVPHVQAIDTTGAGDAFLGALAYMLATYQNLSVTKCIEVACQMASLSVQKQGTQISYANRHELKNLLTKMDI